MRSWPRPVRRRLGAPRPTRVVVVTAILLGLPGEPHAERLPTRRFTTVDGLPRDQVHRVIADSRGFVWMVSHGAISRFDGSSFLSFDPEHGFPHQQVYTLIEGGDGDYLLATAAGFSSSIPRRLTRRG